MRGAITPLSNTPSWNGAQLKHRDSFTFIFTFYGMGDRGFESRQRLGTFLFTTASRPALGPTHLPIQWVPGGKVAGA
jgi:hypothetical protein